MIWTTFFVAMKEIPQKKTTNHAPTWSKPYLSFLRDSPILGTKSFFLESTPLSL